MYAQLLCSITMLLLQVYCIILSYFALFSCTGHYSFYRQNLRSTPVSTIYADCSSNNLCFLSSTATHTELPIAVSQWNKIDSDSNCVVNFVEIIHDCVPRLVELDLIFASHGTDNLYLKVKNVITCAMTQQVQ